MKYTGEEFGQALAAQLRAEKAASGLTLDAIAARVGVSKMTIRRYLSGDRHVDVPHLVDLADTFDLPLDELIARSKDRL